MINRNKLLLTTAVLGLLTACSEEPVSESSDAETEEVVEDTDENVNNSEASEDNNQETVEQEPEDNLGKRSNPVPLGETVQVDVVTYDDESNAYDGKATISISNLVRGEEAYNSLLEMNELNEEAPEGFEWVLFDVSLTLDELETEDVPVYVAPSILGFSSDGSQQPDEFYPTTDPEFGWVDLYAGGSTEGKAAVLVPIDDEEALIEISDLEYSVFFETQ